MAPPAAGERRDLRVVDPQGQPLPGVLARSGDLDWPVDITTAEGLLKVPVRRGEEASVRLFTADGRQQKVTLAPLAGDPTAEPVPEVVFPDPVLIRGRVLDAASRQPLGGALVWPGPEPGVFVRTDSQGRYAIVAPLSDRFWLQAEAAGHVPRRTQVNRSQLAASQAATLALLPAVAVGGRVVDTAGVEVIGSWLAAVPSGRRAFSAVDRAASRSISGAEGKFTLAGLEPGQGYTLIASKPGYGTATLTTLAPPLHGNAMVLVVPQVELVLVADRPAVGRVVDLEEKPIPEAVVLLRVHGVRPEIGASPVRKTDQEDPFRAHTNAEGRFRAAVLPSAEIDVLLAAPGFAPMVVRQVEVPPGQGPAELGTFVLVPGSTITGKVQDAQEQPVEGAVVHALEEESGELARRGGIRSLGLDRREPEAKTDPDGTFVVKNLPAGSRKTLWVGADGFLSASVEGVEVSSVGVEVPGVEPLLVVLEKASRIAGRVVDEEDRPIAGASLDLLWQDVLPEADREIHVGPRESRSTVSDVDGRFEIEGVRPGLVYLTASAERFVPLDRMEVEVPEEDGVDDLLFVLEKGTVVTGQVHDTEGEALANVRILAGRAAGRTDAEGFYRLEGARLGPGKARATHPYYGDFERQVELRHGTNRLDWTLPAGREVAGRVVDAGEEPIAQAEVQLTLQKELEPRTYNVYSASDGSFLFETVGPGSYRLSATAAGFAPGEQGATFAVADQSVTNLQIVLAPGGRVGGQILGLEFDELAQVRVEAGDGRSSQRGEVDHQGNYEIADLAPGSWLVTATLDAGRRQAKARVSLQPGTLAVQQDLEFGGGLVLSGQVLHGGEPLSGAKVTIRGSQMAIQRSVHTDHRGEFRFAELDRGEYKFHVGHQREMVNHSDVIELVDDQSLLLDLRSATVRGLVAEKETGRPLAGAIVTLARHGAGQGLLGIGTDLEGRFSIPRVRDGHYSVVTKKDGYAPAKEEIDVLGGQDFDELRIELNPAPGLELQVTLASGQTPSTVEVMVLSPTGEILLAEPRPAMAGGSVLLPTVPPGEWELLASAPGGGLASSRVVVPGDPVVMVLPPAGQLQVQVRELESSTLLASFSLLGPNGQPLRVIDVAARGFRDHWPIVGGGATVDGVPAGVWTLRVEAPDGRRWSKTVVTEGRDAIVVVDGP